MFTKHVWHDARHRAEIFISENSVVSGAIVAHQGAVCLINPRTEILAALYNEAKIKRILSIKAIILTDNTIEYTRGICAFINYSRALRRSAPLRIITRSDTTLSTDFLNSFCSRLHGDGSFEIEIVPVKAGKSVELGIGLVRFVRPPKSAGGGVNPYLVVKTGERTLHYYDETHAGQFDKQHVVNKAKPDVVIRAAELLRKSREMA